jgi:WD40 repeat protein
VPHLVQGELCFACVCVCVCVWRCHEDCVQLHSLHSTRACTYTHSLHEQRHLATGDHKGRLAIYDLEAINTPVFSVQAHSSIINCIDGVGGLNTGYGAPELATGGRDGCVKIWDPRQQVRRIRAPCIQPGMSIRWSVDVRVCILCTRVGHLLLCVCLFISCPSLPWSPLKVKQPATAGQWRSGIRTMMTTALCAVATTMGTSKCLICAPTSWCGRYVRPSAGCRFRHHDYVLCVII